MDFNENSAVYQLCTVRRTQFFCTPISAPHYDGELQHDRDDQGGGNREEDDEEEEDEMRITMMMKFLRSPEKEDDDGYSST